MGWAYVEASTAGGSIISFIPHVPLRTGAKSLLGTDFVTLNPLLAIAPPTELLLADYDVVSDHSASEAPPS